MQRPEKLSFRGVKKPSRQVCSWAGWWGAVEVFCLATWPLPNLVSLGLQRPPARGPSFSGNNIFMNCAQSGKKLSGLLLVLVPLGLCMARGLFASLLLTGGCALHAPSSSSSVVMGAAMAHTQTCTYGGINRLFVLKFVVVYWGTVFHGRSRTLPKQATILVPQMSLQGHFLKGKGAKNS